MGCEAAVGDDDGVGWENVVEFVADAGHADGSLGRREARVKRFPRHACLRRAISWT